MSELYDSIVALCRKRRMAPTAVATKAGISPALLSDLKYGRKKTMTLPTAQKLAAVLEVPVEDLLGEPIKKAPAAENGDEGISKEKQLLINKILQMSEEQVDAFLVLIERFQATTKNE